MKWSPRPRARFHRGAIQKDCYCRNSALPERMPQLQVWILWDSRSNAFYIRYILEGFGRNHRERPYKQGAPGSFAGGPPSWRLELNCLKGKLLIAIHLVGDIRNSRVGGNLCLWAVEWVRSTKPAGPGECPLWYKVNALGSPSVILQVDLVKDVMKKDHIWSLWILCWISTLFIDIYRFLSVFAWIPERDNWLIIWRVSKAPSTLIRARVANSFYITLLERSNTTHVFMFYIKQQKRVTLISSLYSNNILILVNLLHLAIKTKTKLIHLFFQLNPYWPHTLIRMWRQAFPSVRLHNWIPLGILDGVNSSAGNPRSITYPTI